MSGPSAKKRTLIYGRPVSGFPGGTTYCPGCQHGSVLRLICEVIDELDIQGKAIGISGVGCHGFMSWFVNTDFVFSLHGRAPAVGTGIKRALRGKPIVFTIQGDGDLAAIGLGDIINAVNRGEKLTTIFVNNAGYGTTGGQMAPTTLLEQVTTTTPQGRDPENEGYPAHIAEMLAPFKGMAYIARCALTSPPNYQKARKALRRAFEKQIQGVGYSLVEFLAACPSTLQLKPAEAIRWINDSMIEEYPLGVFKDVDAC